MNAGPFEKSGGPRLLPELRIALATLYNLPGCERALDATQCHYFLTTIQSRNVRRAIRSACQKQASSRKGVTTPSDKVTSGSSWLACLALLCHSHAHDEERLFCAQTLIHRLRRTKIVEAVDVEIENLDPNTAVENFNNLCHVERWSHSYMHVISTVHTFLFRATQEWAKTAMGEQHDEILVKGEMSLTALSAASYLAARSAIESNMDHHSILSKTNPILSTLGSTIAALAFRLRFECGEGNAGGHQGSTRPHTTALVPMVTQCLQSVANIAATNHDDSSSQHHTNVNNLSLLMCAAHVLAAIPDTVLGSPGGARERLSIDASCIQSAHEELRDPSTGVMAAMESLVSITEPLERHGTFIGHYYLLYTCESWAKFLPLPAELVQHTVPLASRYLSSSHEPAQKPAFGYLIAIFESATKTVDKILASSLGLTSSKNQPNKKRTSSRSKRRHQQRVDSESNETRRQRAQADHEHSGQVACLAAQLSLESLRSAALVELRRESTGEGPVGVLAACANACLPHMIQQSEPPSKEARCLFEAIAASFQHLCSSNERTVRAMSYEPLFELHSAVLRAPKTADKTLMEVAVEHLYLCALQLASSCGYPQDYFMKLDAESNEDIEIERNDVRDVLRTVSSADGYVSEQSQSAPLHILHRLLAVFAESVRSTSFPQENIVHAFSAVAKPINQLAIAYVGGSDTEESRSTLLIALTVLAEISDRLIKAIPCSPVCDVLPASRVMNLATASLAPGISALVRARDQEFTSIIQRALDRVIHASAISIIHVPELCAPSILAHSQYDIRGAMRGPGGEDHVGCLTLMRLTFESAELAEFIVHLMGPSLIPELCNICSQLKRYENERGPLVDHGKGVTPKSRRILLNTTCHLGLISSQCIGKNESLLNFPGELRELFTSNVLALSTISSNTFEDAKDLFGICEATMDLAAFPPDIIHFYLLQESAVEESEAIRQSCIRVLIDAGLFGYNRLSISSGPGDLEVHWGRTRGSLLALIRALKPASITTTFAREALVTWNKAECTSANIQIHAGSHSTSSIFHDSVIGEDCVPAGAFVKAISEALDHVELPSREQPERKNLADEAKSLVDVLRTVCSSVLQLLLMQLPESARGCYIDPRTAMAEAWFSAMSSLARLFQKGEGLVDAAVVKELLSETSAAAVLVLYLPDLKTQGHSKAPTSTGMSMDGPHTLTLLQSLDTSLRLGGEVMQSVSFLLQGKIEFTSLTHGGLNGGAGMEGMAVCGAAVLRSASGALPPWAVEELPKIFMAIFLSSGNNVEFFEQMLVASLRIKTSTSGRGFGGLQPGEFLAGNAFATMSDAAKQNFVRETVAVCAEGQGGWRRLKTLLKKAGGGKKVCSGYSLKPSFTTWDCDRM